MVTTDEYYRGGRDDYWEGKRIPLRKRTVTTAISVDTGDAYVSLVKLLVKQTETLYKEGRVNPTEEEASNTIEVLMSQDDIQRLRDELNEVLRGFSYRYGSF